MSMIRLFFVVWLLLLLPLTAYADPYRIVEVTDGYTVVIEPVEGGDRTKVRLHGIDALNGSSPWRGSGAME